MKGIARFIHDDFDRAILSNWACGFFPGQSMSEALIGAHIRRVIRNGYVNHYSVSRSEEKSTVEINRNG